MKCSRILAANVVVLASLIALGCANNKCPYSGDSKTDAKSASEASKGKPCPAKAAASLDKGKSFGTPFKWAEDALCIKKVLDDPSAFDGKQVQVLGKVASVCAKRGCWLRLGDGEQDKTLFVKFTCPVEGRLIPMEAQGKVACINGKITLAEISESEARHYKEDSGASKEEIEKIVGPQKILRMASPGARIAGL